MKKLTSDIEVRCIFTSINDEDHKFDSILKGLFDKGDVILGATREYCLRCRRVNSLLSERIRCIFGLDGFTGKTTLGSRKGSYSPHADVGVLASCAYTIGDGNDDDDSLKDGGGDVDEADTDQPNGLINFVASL